jgi:hypothetical protein
VESYRPRLALLLPLALIGVLSLLGVRAPRALACTPTHNPDGSYTCSQSHSDVGCPLSPGSVTAFAAEEIPADAAVTGYKLSFAPDPPCNNATVSEAGFDANASTPSPPAGEKTARLDYKITCNATPCGPGTNPRTSFSVVFTRPGKPDPAGLIAPKTVKVGLRSPILMDFLTREDDQFKDWDCIDFLWYGVTFTTGYTAPYPSHRASARRGFVPLQKRKKKLIKIGSSARVHHSAGRSFVRMTLTLNARGRKALAAAGKLQAIVKGRLRNAAGSVPFTAHVKLVKRKKRGATSG